MEVSLCVREWIETGMEKKMKREDIVSLCVREWIETIREKIMYLICPSPSA